MIIDLKNKTINRVKDNLELELDFNNNICNVVSDGLKFKFNIDVVELDIHENNFLVKYKVESDYFEIEIKMI
ncbi:MAG: hypothetical protein IJ068_03225 [Bacilli bacterium]|nr:hypothetical protein [Bacilli bacterium]